jgi:hypothetical protein
VELSGKVAGERRADPSAKHHDAAAHVAENLYRLVDVPM